jgi:hypothetical protein
MFNLKSRTAYTMHCLRGMRQGFVAMSYRKFVLMGMFSI